MKKDFLPVAIGVDSGTQGTKVLIVDFEGKVHGRGYHPHRCGVSAKFGQMRAFLKLQIICDNLKLGEMHDNRFYTICPSMIILSFVNAGKNKASFFTILTMTQYSK